MCVKLPIASCEVSLVVFFEIQKVEKIRNINGQGPPDPTHAEPNDHRIPYYNCKACQSSAINSYTLIIVTASSYSVITISSLLFGNSND